MAKIWQAVRSDWAVYMDDVTTIRYGDVRTFYVTAPQMSGAAPSGTIYYKGLVYTPPPGTNVGVYDNISDGQSAVVQEVIRQGL